jgi:hypothetical protein
LRCILAITGLVSLAFIPVVPNGGLAYSPLALACAVIGLVAALAACGWPEETEGTRAVLPLGLLAAVAVILSGVGAVNAELFYPGGAAAKRVMIAAAWTGFVATGSLLLHFRPVRRACLFPTQMGVVFVAGALLRLSAVWAVPDPPIDVYVAFRDAPAHLLHGRNPYSASYESPYPYPPAAYDAYPFYPPLPIVLCTPFRAAGLDIRYANVVCDLLAAWILFLAGRCRGSPLVGALAAATYLNLPRVPLLIEQAWYEPMLAALLGGGLLLAERGRRLGWLLLGLGLTGKQYGLVMLPPIWKAQRGRRWSLLAGLVAAAAGLLLPFFLWDPRAFLDVVLLRHLERPVHPDSVTLRSGAYRMFDLLLPGPAMVGLMAVGIGWVVWRTPAKGTASALWAGTALLVFLLFHKQAFCNYFYLCDYLLLLGIAGLATSDSQQFRIRTSP